jgi:molybdenum cofactor biosynthesis enzyme MoaA
MPREVFGRDYVFLERAELLTFEEIERLARVLVGDHGVRKVRLTGSEPLVRRELERLVEMLARIPGLGDLALTTNGSALARRARALKDAGLRRITVSLDGLDNEVFAAINDVGFAVERVLAGIEAAAAAGARADQDQHDRQARRQRGRRGADGPALPRQRPCRALHRSTWTWATATAAGLTKWCWRRRSWR